MVIWVAVLPRVDQLTKVMPNFWRAVYMHIVKQVLHLFSCTLVHVYVFQRYICSWYWEIYTSRCLSHIAKNLELSLYYSWYVFWILGNKIFLKNLLLEKNVNCKMKLRTIPKLFPNFSGYIVEVEIFVYEGFWTESFILLRVRCSFNYSDTSVIHWQSFSWDMKCAGLRCSRDYFLWHVWYKCASLKHFVWSNFTIKCVDKHKKTFQYEMKQRPCSHCSCCSSCWNHFILNSDNSTELEHIISSPYSMLSTRCLIDLNLPIRGSDRNIPGTIGQ